MYSVQLKAQSDIWSMMRQCLSIAAQSVYTAAQEQIAAKYTLTRHPCTLANRGAYYPSISESAGGHSNATITRQLCGQGGLLP